MAEKDTWERLEHLGNAIDLVEEFEKKIRKKKEKIRKLHKILTNYV